MVINTGKIEAQFIGDIISRIIRFCSMPEHDNRTKDGSSSAQNRG